MFDMQKKTKNKTEKTNDSQSPNWLTTKSLKILIERSKYVQSNLIRESKNNRRLDTKSISEQCNVLTFPNRKLVEWNPIKNHSSIAHEDHEEGTWQNGAKRPLDTSRVLIDKLFFHRRILSPRMYVYVYALCHGSYIVDFLCFILILFLLGAWPFYALGRQAGKKAWSLSKCYFPFVVFFRRVQKAMASSVAFDGRKRRKRCRNGLWNKAVRSPYWLKWNWVYVPLTYALGVFVRLFPRNGVL